MITTVNPTTGEEIQSYEVFSNELCSKRLDLAITSSKTWQKTTLDSRLNIVSRIGSILRSESQTIAHGMCEEMGKPFAQGIAEAEKCALVCDYYVEHAQRILADQYVKTEAGKSYVCYQPIGLVLGIMPWNFPFWQVIRFAVPALIVGNGVLLKHAPISTGSALLLEKIMLDAGVPQYLFNTLILDETQTANLIGDTRVAAVTLTGSERAGRAVAARAGAALKKCVLELGGSDPLVVLGDADLNLAAETAVFSRMINNGQSCIASKRLIAVESVYDEFLDLVIQAMKQYKMKSPADKSSNLGPIARMDLRDNLHVQVEKSQTLGAKIELGGEVPDVPGFWYPATVLSGVKPGMPAFDEEVFGPVAVVIKAADERDALMLAGSTPYGLGASVFTRDLEKAERIALADLDAGGCFVNSLVKSDPRLPFGGIKASGYGRELGEAGLLEFVNMKTIYIG
jgi:succinate-semialdehyde dehydrogenase / glutarate-semialdehyde dehydrogenase